MKIFWINITLTLTILLFGHVAKGQDENIVPEKSERQKRIEKERREFNGKVWILDSDMTTTYSLKIYCEDVHGEDVCREFPTDEEKEQSDAAKKLAKEQKEATAQAKKQRIDAIKGKQDKLTDEEIKEALGLLIN